MKNKIVNAVSFFFLLFILFFPLDFFGNLQLQLTKFLFGNLVEAISTHLFGFRTIKIAFSSDSLSMLILIALIVILSVILAAVIPHKKSSKLSVFTKEICFIYIAIVLLKYGFDKIFKAQFYLPEPNILYSRLGNLDRDILYWSTMGTSHLYSIFLGSIEVIIAVLLIFRKTQTIGAILSTLLFLNIFFVNIGFDISVKFFSLILLWMSLYLLKDDLKPIYRFLILKNKEQIITTSRIDNPKYKAVFVTLKTAILGFAIISILQPYFWEKEWNDDNSQKPYLHGCFKVKNENNSIKYIFFHRNYYLILLDQNEKFTDYQYSLNQATNRIEIKDRTGQMQEIPYTYSKKDSLLTLSFPAKTIEAKEINWKQMNALQPKIHWIIEAIK